MTAVPPNQVRRSPVFWRVAVIAYAAWLVALAVLAIVHRFW